MGWRASRLCLLTVGILQLAQLPSTLAAAANGSGIAFEGNVLFSRSQLLQALRRYHVTLEGDFARSSADDAAYFLREFYFDQGFANAGVTYSFSSPPSAVVFSIDEGERRLIRSVRFDGNEALSAERLRGIFDTSVRQANLHPFGRLRYVATSVDFAIAEIGRALRQMGFLDAVATVERVDIDGTEVDLTIRVNDGILYHVSNIEVMDATGDASELEAMLSESLGSPYQEAMRATLRTRAQDWYQNRGHLNPLVLVDAVSNPETGDVSLTLTAEPGRRYRLGSTRVEGLTRTSESAVLTRMDTKSGDWYNAAQVDDGVRRLWFSGAFAEVNAVPEIIDNETVDILLKVEEGRAKQVRFKIGYNEWERGFGEIQYVDRNFLGMLNRFSVDSFVSQRGYGIRSTVANPWFLGTDATGTIGAFYSRRELPAYESTEFGGAIGIERRYNLPNETGYRLAYAWKRATDSVIFGDTTNTGATDYTIGGIAFSQTWDTRNSVITPMKGIFATYDVEVASPFLLGDLSFFKAEAQFTFYQPLQEITTERPFVPFLVFNQLAGALVPYGDTKYIPVQERFFLGGPTTMRSYQLYGFGPKDSDGYPTGGLGMLLGTAELQWPVWNNIYTVFFTDVGNLAADVNDLSWGNTQVAIGSGLRIYTPIGAIRVDYGYNLIRDSGDPIGNWQIGFGLTF